MVSSDKNGLVNNNVVRLKKSRHDIIKDDMRERQLLPDPFTNEIVLEPKDKLILALGTIFILPFRSLAVVLSLCLAWFVAKIGLFGLSTEEVNSCLIPRNSWRLKLMEWYAIFGKLVFWSAGFFITVEGKQATRGEAPVLVGAPHSSFLEALIIIMCGCSPVSRHENRYAFLISACQLFYQTIFVDRRSSEGRRKAILEISARARSPDLRLPQVFICPEGTNSNRKVLIQFKVGAFAPGVPVQPVVIRYPGFDRLDAITWTFHQKHSYLYSVWFLLANPINRVSIEFLPVCTPTQDEIANPELYAKRVQVVMAESLGIPATDITYAKYYDEYCRKNNTLSPEQKGKEKKAA